MLIINWLKKNTTLCRYLILINKIVYEHIMLNALLIWMYLYKYISFGGYHEMN